MYVLFSDCLLLSAVPGIGLFLVAYGVGTLVTIFLVLRLEAELDHLYKIWDLVCVLRSFLSF